MILILGNSDLGSAIQKLIPTAIILGRPKIDIRSQEDCDLIVNTYDPTVVINTIGILQNSNPWDILLTNYVAGVYLTLEFYEKMQFGQIINISSASTYWPSYPGIDKDRLCYNISKEALSQFGRHFNRKIVDDNKLVTVTTIEIGKFNSKFNNNSGGMEIDKAAKIVKQVIDNPVAQISVLK